jgi:hypothetical protein
MVFKSIYDPSMDEKALAAYKEGKSIVGICVELGISRETYYRWRDDETHPFSEIAKAGETISQQWWEDRGKDAIFGGVDKFAGSSWQFVMKNRFRNDYADQQAKDPRDTLIDKLLAKDEK